MPLPTLPAVCTRGTRTPMAMATTAATMSAMMTSSDVDAIAKRIKEHGGTLDAEPADIINNAGAPQINGAKVSIHDDAKIQGGKAIRVDLQAGQSRRLQD